MPTVLITGASRGLGLEFARQYLAEGWHVIATCRNPAQAHALRALEGKIDIHSLDVTDSQSIATLGAALAGMSIDVLLINAGVHLQKDRRLDELDAGLWLEELQVNTIAPVILARRLADNVARSEWRRIVAISSGSGSVTGMKNGGNYAYRTGKAALNAAMKMLAADLGPRGITVVPIGPGHTRTDMGGAEAPYSATDSVARVRGVIGRLTFEDSGSFRSRDGATLPW